MSRSEHVLLRKTRLIIIDLDSVSFQQSSRQAFTKWQMAEAVEVMETRNSDAYSDTLSVAQERSEEAAAMCKRLKLEQSTRFHHRYVAR